MNKLERLNSGYYTQREELSIEERIFVKELAGVRATFEYFRLATDDEVAEWKAYQKKQEEEQYGVLE